MLVTDGRDNGSQTQWDDLSREAARLKVPIHVYGIGGSAAGFLVLKDAAIQDTLFVEDTVTVPFRFRAQGLKDAEVEISLTLGGKVVASKRVAAKDGQDVTETLSFTPEKEDAATNLNRSIDLLAKIPTMTAAFYRARHDGSGALPPHPRRKPGRSGR